MTGNGFDSIVLPAGKGGEAIPWSVVYENDECYVHIINTGAITIEDAVDEARECVRLSELHGTTKLLLDGRGRRSFDIQPHELLDLPRLYDEIFVKGRQYRLACVMPVGKTFDEGMRFFETMLTNRGYQVKVFSDYDDAVEWL